MTRKPIRKSISNDPMTNKDAAAFLTKNKKRLVELFGRPDAFDLAIAALGSSLLDYKKAGAKGGKMRSKKYGPDDFKKWGKMGGRPEKTQ